MANQPVFLVPSQARNANGNAVAKEADRGLNLAVLLSVTAVSGTTPTLDVSVEWSHDGGTTFAPAETPDAFTQITATKAVVKSFVVKANTYRLVWTIGGTTPSFTFSASTMMTD
jgi:hypothetical protein